MDRDRALMRKLFDMALQGKVPAIQLVLARLAQAQTALNAKAEPQAIDKARGAGSAIATLPSARSNAPSPRPRRSSASASICPSARRGSRPSRRRSRASRCPNTSIRSIRWFSFSTCSTIAIAGRSICRRWLNIESSRFDRGASPCAMRRSQTRRRHRSSPHHDRKRPSSGDKCGHAMRRTDRGTSRCGHARLRLSQRQVAQPRRPHPGGATTSGCPQAAKPRETKPRRRHVRRTRGSALKRRSATARQPQAFCEGSLRQSRRTPEGPRQVRRARHRCQRGW
jgi:hypothetical protein